MTERAVIWLPETGQSTEVVADALPAWRERGWVLIATRNPQEEAPDGQ